MEEYKGIYYGDETEQQFYEGGAHFKYSKLYKILEILSKERNEIEKKKELLYVHKNKNLNNSKNTKINKKTRNVINDMDINKVQYNTINNNYNNINYNIKNNFNIFLSINKENNKNKNENKSLINNKNKNDKNLSLSNNKKEIYSRNKETIKPYRGRPNTIFKDGFHKMLYSKKKKLLSLSMEHKNKYKNRCPVNLKRSLPELNYDNYKIISDNKINDNSYNNNKIKVYKNKNIKNFKNKFINNDIRPNISYNNANKTSIKTERNQQSLLDNKNDTENENNITQHNTQNNNKISEKLYNRINHTSSIKISKKVHNIIKKRIVGKKVINPKPQSNISSNVFQKSKIDKGKINTFLNKSNKKDNNTKKDFIIDDNNKTLKEENTNFKKYKFNSIKNDSNNKNLNLTGKKIINLKKIDKNTITKKNNNQLSVNKFIGKSRNYVGDNSSFHLKNTLNNNNINNQNTFFKNYYKTIGDINKTYDNNNKNIILNMSSGKNNNNNPKIKQNNKINQIYRPSHQNKNNLNDNKKQYVIKPYIQIKQNNNNLKNKINMNNSIRVNKKNSNNCFNINVNEND